MSLETFIHAMPKVELFVQLEGALQRETLMMFADQNEIRAEVRDFQNWLGLFDQPDYQRLDEIAAVVNGWLRYPDEISRIVYDLGVSLAKQNVRYAEVGITPALYMGQGMTYEQFMEAVNDGRDRVLRGWNVRMNWVLTIPRDRPRTGDDVARWATSATARKGFVVAIGLCGREDTQPAAQFKRAFATADKKELSSVSYAGDWLGAEGLLDVLETLAPARVLASWGVAESPEAIGALVERDVTLGICMTRELRLGRIASYSEYPLRRLYDEDVKLFLGTSMPAFYGASLTDEYLAAVQHAGLGMDELKEVALNAVRASLLPEDEKQAMLEAFTAEYTRLEAEHLPAGAASAD